MNNNVSEYMNNLVITKLFHFLVNQIKNQILFKPLQRVMIWRFTDEYHFRPEATRTNDAALKRKIFPSANDNNNQMDFSNLVLGNSPPLK